MTRVRYLSSYLEWVSHQDFKNVGCFRAFVCVFVFVILFVFVFMSSYDFWIAFIISFQNMYGYRDLWSLRAEIMVIFEVMTDRHTQSHTSIPLIDSADPVGWAEWKNMHHLLSKKFQHWEAWMTSLRNDTAVPPVMSWLWFSDFINSIPWRLKDDDNPAEMFFVHSCKVFYGGTHS